MPIIFLLCFLSSSSWAAEKKVLPEVSVLVRLRPTGEFVAKTHKVKGQVWWRDGKFAASPIEVDLKSLHTGKELRDDHLQERLWVEKYPVASLRKITELAPGKGQAELFLRGQWRLIFFNFAQQGEDQIAADFELSLKQLGIEEISYLGLSVENTIYLKVLLPLIKMKQVKTF